MSPQKRSLRLDPPYFGNKHLMGFSPCLLSLMALIAVELTDEF